jgi:hypothetical protein
LFYQAALAEMSLHLQPTNHPTLRTARETFDEKEKAIAAEYSVDANGGLPTRKGPHVDLLSEYWKVAGLVLPALKTLYNVLKVCSASEAECERYFSSEAIVHSNLRNALEPGLVNDILFVQYNQKAIKEQEMIKEKFSFNDSDQCEEIDFDDKEEEEEEEDMQIM